MSKKRPTVGEIRNLQRTDVKRFNDNRVSLPNPAAAPAYDRHAPIPSTQKALAFGMEPTSPKRLFELPKGDAGAGQTVYRKIHAFYSLAQPGDFARVGASNYTKALPIITMRSANQNPKYWHISLYGIGVRRIANNAGLEPLTQSEIRSQQFEAYFVETAPGVFTELTPRFVPSVCTAQARIMVHDESGQRFFDADIIGNRSFSVYGWGATVFLMVKPDGYEVDAQNPDSIVPLTGNDAGVEDDCVGGRIVGIFTNRTESIQNRSLSITIDPSNFGAAEVRRIVPIPPGSRRVQIISTDPLADTRWLLEFWYGRCSSVTRSDVGRIQFNAGQSRTSIVEIPNAASISITPTNPPATPITSFSLVFEVEP